MKRIYFLVLLFCLGFVGIAHAGIVTDVIPSFKEAEIKNRLEGLDQVIIAVDGEDQTVHSYIRNYVIKNRKSAERILGRTAVFFPLFEKKIAEYGLPNELKYLAIVESALDPHAISPVGAAGLWQFMPGTGKQFGLRINATVDERMDPVKSTNAAMKYLSQLYDRFGDWALALAAYNSGAGRVNYAIKRSKSTDFWELKKYLPRETRNYVPAFIAAMYLFQYHHHHGLQGNDLGIDLQVTDNVELTSFLSFFRISQITGVPLATIRRLNPGYRKEYIPANKEGNYVILPARACFEFRRQLIALENGADVNYSGTVFMKKTEKTERNYSHSFYHLSAGESLPDFAKSIGYSVSQLLAWNEDLSYFQNEASRIRVYRSFSWIDEQEKPVKMPEVAVLSRLVLRVVSGE